MKFDCCSAIGAGLALILLGACSGSGSSPTAPDGVTPKQTLATEWGPIALDTDACGPVDQGLLIDSVRSGYERARQDVGPKIDSIRLDGLTITGHPDLVCAGTAAYGCYFFDRDQLRFRCGSENVIDHELQHRFCDRLDNPCDCYMTDHAGGFDLNCEPV